MSFRFSLEDDLDDLDKVEAFDIMMSSLDPEMLLPVSISQFTSQSFGVKEDLAYVGSEDIAVFDVLDDLEHLDEVEYDS